MKRRDHNWTKEDAIITFFYFQYGTKGLLEQNEKELAESVIGSSFESLKLMCLNFAHLKDESVGYSNVSKHQEEVNAEYSNKTYDELKDIVNNIISNRDLEQNKEEYKAAKKIRDAKSIAKAKAEKKQKEDDEMWRRLGKDPKKMRKVV